MVTKNRLRAAALALILALFVLMPMAQAALQRGSYGDDVTAVQKKLKQWGYYTGAVDGVYGSATEAAVRRFQQYNGLTADGIVGSATAAALGLTLSSSGGSSSSSGSEREIYLLAACIYGEARGEPYKGQVAIGAVILNRVRSSKFPNSIAGVIYQSGAFDAVSDGQINLSPNETAKKAARDAMNGWDPTGGCLYYYNPATATNGWMLSKAISIRIGKHAFCR